MLAILLTCAALAPARAQTDEQLIRALDSAWLAAFTARDTVRLATFYTPDALGMYPNMAMVRGAPAIIRAYRELSAMPALKFSTTTTGVRVAKGGDLATSTGTYRMSSNSPNGPVVDSGSYVTVLQKINGQWKVVNESVTSHAPMAAATAMAFDTVTTMGMTGGSSIAWSDLKVPGFPTGAKMSVIHGDPAGTGDYTLRLQFPDGYQFPVHWHPKAEHATVLSGALLLAPGSKVDASALKTYQAGDFLYLPARNSHFGGAKGVTVIQLHGLGPFAINLGTP
jgi:ketosteroid isomerase-like protein/quercetin dioxygenase-like cupin family protein